MAARKGTQDYYSLLVFADATALTATVFWFGSTLKVKKCQVPAGCWSTDVVAVASAGSAVTGAAHDSNPTPARGWSRGLKFGGAPGQVHGSASGFGATWERTVCFNVPNSAASGAGVW